jgi:hypothetical protein
MDGRKWPISEFIMMQPMRYCMAIPFTEKLSA